MIKIIEARVLDSFRLYVKFSDGAEGEVDLSTLAGQGVFAAWNDPAFFGRVQIGSSGRSLDWSDQIDLSADSLYLNVTGRTVGAGLVPARSLTKGDGQGQALPLQSCVHEGSR